MKAKIIKISVLILFCILIGLAFFYKLSKDNQLSNSKDYNEFIKSSVLIDSQNAKLHKGQFFVISLDMIEGNGYSWYRSDKTNIFKLIDKKVIDVNNTDLEIQKGNRKIGGKIYYLWKFQAVKKGEGKLTFDYYRYWEGLKKSIESKSYLIKID